MKRHSFMHIPPCWLLVLALSTLLPNPASADISRTEVDEITFQIKTNDPPQVAAAVGRINALLEEDPREASTKARRTWMIWLWRGKHYDAIADLSDRIVLARPDSLVYVEHFLNERARALLEANRSEEALPVAKSLFNVSRMPETGGALLLLLDCLAAAHPDDPAVVERFKREQLEGQGADGGKSTVLAGIKIDPQPYLERAKTLTEKQDRYGLASGNLLLMAGKASEARQRFERELAKADKLETRRYGILNVARAIKAEDGVIGPANQWVQKNLPPAGKSPSKKEED